ncbi:MAG: homoaconitate hydratase [Deferribacterota bacterium]|nr:homoaconitate hydratase [Deferribacterota bacterium]
MHIYLDDTTLRDGEQTPGISFNREEKLKIVKYLSALGIDEIEAGIPASGIKEIDDFRAILELDLGPRIIAWNRGLIKDIEKSILAGAKSVEISFPVSDIQIKYKLSKDKKWIIEQLKRVLSYAKEKGIKYISVGGEDSSRADITFLREFILTAKKYNANRFRFCDTLGILDPFKTFEIIKQLIDYTDFDIEFHGHNDFGLATANAIAAYKAGAKYINTTIMGLGERAGNTPLEEIAMYLYYIEKNDKIINRLSNNILLLKEMLYYVSKITRKPIHPQKPIFGDFMFTYESGIHANGVIKNSLNYEYINPEEFNMKRQIVIGKNSGRSMLKKILDDANLGYNEELLEILLNKCKNKAEADRKYLNEKDVINIYNTMTKPVCN